MCKSNPFLFNSILSTLAYSDLFDYPLTEDELYRYLDMKCTKDELRDCLAQGLGVDARDGYIFLQGREEIVEIRRKRGVGSQKAFDRAMFYGRIIGSLPFIRMTAITGSLAMLNLSKNADMDFMLVARRGRVWTARAFVLLFGRVAHLFGDVICPNVIVSETALEWNARNMYTAREFAQMIPVSGADIYGHLMAANPWAQDFLPNSGVDGQSLKMQKTFPAIQKILELLLGGRLGDLFEAWEMERKIARFQKQAGYGLETQFNAEICQGNFDHHSSWTMERYEARLKEILQ